MATPSSSEIDPQSSNPEALEPKTSSQSVPDPQTEKGILNPDERESLEEEEEEGECGFCLFMKGGGCKESFVAWEKCIEEAEENKEDIVEKCFEVTAALKKCMEAHSDYYAPILQAEKAAEAELEEEREKEGSEGSENSSMQVPGNDDPKILQKN